MLKGRLNINPVSTEPLGNRPAALVDLSFNQQRISFSKLECESFQLCFVVPALVVQDMREWAGISTAQTKTMKESYGRSRLSSDGRDTLADAPTRSTQS